MSSLLLNAAAESSKAPWYILGSVLAIWAVILAGIGLNRPDWPHNERGQWTLLGITLVLVVGAIGAAVIVG